MEVYSLWSLEVWLDIKFRCEVREKLFLWVLVFIFGLFGVML